MPIGKVAPDPSQPRKKILESEIEPLAVNIKLNGQLHPIRVWWDEALGKFIIIDGHRRWLAKLQINAKTILCQVVRSADALTILFEQLASNEARSGLTLFEWVLAIKRLRALDPDLTNKGIAGRTGRSPSDVCQLSSFDLLVEFVQAMVIDGRINSLVTMYQLSRLGPDAQIELAEAMAAKKITVDQLRSRVHQIVPKQQREKKTKTTIKLDQGVTMTADDIEKLRAAIDAFLPLIRKAKSFDDLRKPEDPKRPDDQPPDSGSPPPQPPAPPPAA